MSAGPLKAVHVKTRPLDPGLALRKLRLEKGYSQLHVANCLGISRNTYSDWESNKVNLSVKHLVLACSFYEIKLSKLVSDYLEA